MRIIDKVTSIILIAGFTVGFCSLFTPTARAQDRKQEQPVSQPPLRVLFIGNSLTGAHQMPRMVAQIARLKGHPLDVGIEARGGWTLQQHAESAATQERIRNGQWDYVVLQEQSVISARQYQCRTQMIPAVRALCRMIRAAGAEPVFFLPWAHRHGLVHYLVRDFLHMQQQMSVCYHRADATFNSSAIVPVGWAWNKCMESAPLMKLWQKDNIHPTRDAAYLTACVFYCTLYNDSPLGIPDHLKLGPKKAAFLQQIAAKTVLGSKPAWVIE